MADVSLELVKKLREKTGAGMMDCKSALAEAKGDIDLAIEVLRKKGLKDLGKRTGKIAAEGTVGVYVHPGDQIVALVELNSETDFVARGEEFKALARDLAMHVAAMKPEYLTVEDIPEAVISKEKEILIEQLGEKERSKADKILPGKLEKYYEDKVFMKQPYVKDESGKRTVKDMIDELGIKCGEKVAVRRFIRFVVGEGIEKQQSNLAADVAAMMQ